MEVFWTSLFLGGTLIIGHENQVLTFFMQTVSLMIRFVILPFIILINDTEWKQKMIESSWYNLFLDKLNCQYNDQDEDDKENKNDDDCQLHGQNEIDINVIDLEGWNKLNDNEILSDVQNVLLKSDKLDLISLKNIRLSIVF